ncbi:MAG: aminoacyl-tRNA hydrolase [Acidobacteria bacterium RIFCSPLOWO2_02_FULL_67_21]|nr:MAG: aminoacyl-tRNA hydrolase [Acidobacteria bacterium RIFCSPLOWO2_02_FULL_67_21]
MKVIVGLGNPGREYAGTRHNVGFRVADLVGERLGLHWRKDEDVLFAKSFGESPFLVVKPQTFMNRSGYAVARFAGYHQVEPEELLVVLDDVDLPLGRIRVRASGSGGTHNGLKSVVEQLGTTAFPRMRLGVGRGDARRDLADFVLATFEPAEEPDVESLMTRAADAAQMFVVEGIQKVMNAYNPEATAPDMTD